MDPASEQFLRRVHEETTKLDRVNLNGLTVAKQMGLSYEDYIPIVEPLIDAGYLESNTGMRTQITITPAGIAYAKRIPPC